MTTKFADAHHAHLTEEQFTDCVLGLATSEVEAHVAQCRPCYAEVEGLKASILAFSTAGQRWAERQPMPSVNSIRRRVWFYNMRPVAGFAAAVVAVVSIAIPVGRSQREADRIAAIQQTASVATSADMDEDVQVEDEAPKPLHTAHLVAATFPASADRMQMDSLQQDNAMMSAISAEIASPVSGSIQSVVTSASGQ